MAGYSQKPSKRKNGNKGFKQKVGKWSQPRRASSGFREITEEQRGSAWEHPPQDGGQRSWWKKRWPIGSKKGECGGRPSILTGICMRYRAKKYNMFRENRAWTGKSPQSPSPPLGDFCFSNTSDLYTRNAVSLCLADRDGGSSGLLVQVNHTGIPWSQVPVDSMVHSSCSLPPISSSSCHHSWAVRLLVPNILAPEPSSVQTHTPQQLWPGWSLKQGHEGPEISLLPSPRNS